MLKSTGHLMGVWDYVQKRKRKSTHKAKNPQYTRGVLKTHRPNSLPPTSGVGIKTPREGPGSQPKKGGGENPTNKEKEKEQGTSVAN